jgi:putative FmdB family regulatory protein
MPIYEYHCHACEHSFDKRQKISDPPLTVCPACGKNTVDKLVSAAGFQLKGTGWYVTDFKDKKQPKADKADTKSQKKAPEKKAKEKGSKA